jgi:hypothetical protein
MLFKAVAHQAEEQYLKALLMLLVEYFVIYLVGIRTPAVLLKE